MSFKDFCAMHYANGYDKNPIAHHLFNCIGNSLGAAAYADVYNAPAFPEYCEAIEKIDD